MDRNQLQCISKGVTLIETLVALLVLSIGLLGVATLHLQSSKATHSSFFRSLATLIASDAEERMWVHLGQNKTISAADLESIETTWRTAWNDACTTAPNCPPILPGASLSLTSAGTGATWIDVDIEVSWSEGRFNVPQARESFGYRTRLLTGDPG